MLSRKIPYYLSASLCLFGTVGCAALNRPPPSSLADSDPTFRQQLREPSTEKRSWWDLSTYLDERTQQIERHLGY